MHIKSEKQKGAINIYMTEIRDIDRKDVCLKYMVRAGNKYVWPKKPQNCHGSHRRYFGYNVRTKTCEQ